MGILECRAHHIDAALNIERKQRKTLDFGLSSSAGLVSLSNYDCQPDWDEWWHIQLLKTIRITDRVCSNNSSHEVHCLCMNVIRALPEGVGGATDTPSRAHRFF